MQAIFEYLNIRPETVQALVAGVLGGLVRALTLRNGLPDAIIAVIVGGICAVYGTELVATLWGEWLIAAGMPSESINGLSGFLAGVGGITLSGLLLDGWKWVVTRFLARTEEKK